MQPAPAARSEVDQGGLRLEHLHGVRCGRMLFADLSVTARPGQLLRVQGANGAGKTSLLRMICGLLPPAHGRVLWHGHSVASLREEFGRQLVYLGHAAALKAELSALDNLRVALVLGGLAPSRAALLAALNAAGLGGREHAPVRTLSQGLRRRAALARLALSGATPLWVLDEPFNALDGAASSWLLALVVGHVARGGIVVLTSHQSVAVPHTLAQVTVAL
jgi:heme exporter protein A